MTWSLEHRTQNGLERGAPKFPFLLGAAKFSTTCRSITKENEKKAMKKKDIRVCGARKIYVDMVRGHNNYRRQCRRVNPCHVREIG